MLTLLGVISLKLILVYVNVLYSSGYLSCCKTKFLYNSPLKGNFFSPQEMYAELNTTFQGVRQDKVLKFSQFTASEDAHSVMYVSKFAVSLGVTAGCFFPIGHGALIY